MSLSDFQNLITDLTNSVPILGGFMVVALAAVAAWKLIRGAFA